MTNDNQPPTENLEVLGDLLPEEMEKVIGLKRQADQIVHQMGVLRVQEHRLMGQLRQTEEGTNLVLKSVGARLGIADGTPWSVNSEGKALLVGPRPATPTLVPPVDEENSEE